jgi:REP element-mobilizing transposase RayT
MARGIERREIFKDDKDRNSFLQRFAIILEETQTQCYAWALIPNHFHLLLRIGPTPLSKVMRRLMTGYAVTFNKRHKRSGHLFQNRYKSVICEEDPYLLELIRYIHLNPLRACIVNDLKELDKYPWTGHSAILGRRQNPLVSNPTKKTGKTKGKSTIRNPKSEISLAEKTIQDVLLLFSSKLGEARRRYRQFVKNGIDQGTRPDLQGGGLVRSAGGNKAGLLGRKKEEREKGDERILGRGEFVSRILGSSQRDKNGKPKEFTIEGLIEKVSNETGIDAKDILSGSRRHVVSNARAVLAYMAVREMGHRGSELGDVLGISEPAVSKCVERGKIILDNKERLRYKLIN